MNFRIVILLVIIGFHIVVQAYAQNCDTAKIGNRSNLGIYGGLTQDFAFSNSGRLFASSLTPASLFISDDTGNTWYRAFPYDSLIYECETRGWGGGGEKVLTNQKGWVAVHAESINGDVSAGIINFHNGDTGKWKTAIDAYLLTQLGYNATEVTGVGLTDYYMYTLLKTYIARVDSTNKIDTAHILDLSNEIPGLDTLNCILTSIAVANSTSGYPFYVILDSISSSVSSPKGTLYKFDGSSLTAVSTPSTLSGILKVFTHPNQVTADTIFITGKAGTSQKIYRSFNGGSTWVDVSCTPGSYLKDVEYSPNWNFTSSNNIILTNEKAGISFDLGNTWKKSVSIAPYSSTPPSVVVFYPNDSSIAIAGDKKGSYKGSSGYSGSFIAQSNKGFEAIVIWDIERNNSKTIFYIATRSGLAYTTKYNDSTVTNVDKWISPNGQFPVNGVTEPIYAVGIDPLDSLHVIAGAATGLYVSTGGPDSFSFNTPSGYTQVGCYTQDIAFVNSNIVIAITGTTNAADIGNGEIWRSADGGISWNIVSPSSFGTGRTVAVGYSATDTVIYVGSGLADYEHGVLWKSTDLGLNWTQINTGPNAGIATQLAINKIVVDPRGTDTLYILARYKPSFTFVKSTDGGLSYQDLLQNMSSTEKAFDAIEIDPSYPDTVIYLSFNQKLLQYNSLLDTSLVINTGLPGEVINDIAIGSILAGTTTGFYTFHPTWEDIVVSVHSIDDTKNVFLTIYPNPITNEASISLEGLATTSNLKITLYDVMGRNVKQLYNSDYISGNAIRFDASSLSNGIYYLHINSSETTITQKIIISKM